jgi:L-aminopeptidase/D-esterase-like protein
VRGVSEPLRGGVAIVGRATGSRDLLAISPDHLVDGRVDAIMLTGGSAYGLDAAAGVMRWMEERGRGFSIGTGVVPIVPAAVVFDLTPLGRFDARPTADMAYAATDSARSAGIAEGAVGAGTGTTVGKIGGPALVMKGGVGLAVEGDADNGVAAFALAVVNASATCAMRAGESSPERAVATERVAFSTRWPRSDEPRRRRVRSSRDSRSETRRSPSWA